MEIREPEVNHNKTCGVIITCQAVSYVIVGRLCTQEAIGTRFLNYICTLSLDNCFYNKRRHTPQKPLNTTTRTIELV